mmetsp:Transcript_8552/g.20310  ORF Transcript_8552/g.20310 Transcript_8552/m.20310 type:complete len:405 (+) Transcript_8552:1211-2425(+)
MARLVVLGTSGSTDHLHHVHGRQLVPLALLGIVDLRALDDDGVGRQVHTPRQSGCGHQDLDVSVGVQILHQLSISTGQTGVVHSKSVRKQVLHLGRLHLLSLCLQNLSGGRIFLQKLGQGVILHCQVTKRLRSFYSLLPGMHKNQNLILSCVLHQLLVANFVHGVEALDGLLVCDTNVSLLQWDRPVVVSKVVQALLRIDAQKDCYILVVGQRGGQSHQSNMLLGGLDLPNCARHDCLEHRPTAVVQQVDLVDDDQSHQLRVSTLVSCFSGDDVPLLWSGDDDLGLVNLGLREVHVATQLTDGHSVGLLQTLGEALHHLLHQSLHGRNIHDLEASQVEGAVLQAELVHDVEDRQHRNVGLATTRRRTDQHVLAVFVECGLEDLALHRVELCGARKGFLAPGRKL